MPDGQEIIPDGAVDMEYVIARAAAFAAISERYGEQAPRSGLPWAVEDVTPDGQGSPVFQYSAEDWVVTKIFCAEAPDFRRGEEAQLESCVERQLVVEYWHKNNRSMDFR
jgi:hypothetical protein